MIGSTSVHALSSSSLIHIASIGVALTLLRNQLRGSNSNDDNIDKTYLLHSPTPLLAFSSRSTLCNMSITPSHGLRVKIINVLVALIY